jgi:hypothetical protein
MHVFHSRTAGIEPLEPAWHVKNHLQHQSSYQEK